MAASESTLGDLHAKVAEALTEQVAGYELEEDGVTKIVRPSPALLGAAIAFLKNNNITADPTENAELAGLSKALAARRKNKSSLSQAQLDEAATAFAQANGGTLQ